MEKKPIKLAMLMTDMEDLGAQRVVINLFNHFDQAQIQPILILWTMEGKLKECLKNHNGIIELDNKLNSPRFFFRLFRYISTINSVRPDVVLSFVPATNISYGLIKLFLPKQIKFICSEHAFISSAIELGEYKGMFKVLYLLTFRLIYNTMADHLIMVANAAKKDAIKKWGICEDRIKVIYNPQDLKSLRRKSKEEIAENWTRNKSNPYLISVGRLTKQKGFDSLLRVFKVVRSRYSCRLVIIGRGELESALKIQAKQLGIEKDVTFLGFQANPFKYMKNAKLLILSSVWEAMPMIIGEAMAIGLPVVAYDCPSGPNEMLDAGDCGFLVKNQDEQHMIDTILLALKHTDLALEKSKKALKRVEKFKVADIVRSYSELILSSNEL